jgi:hypothetical protein
MPLMDHCGQQGQHEHTNRIKSNIGDTSDMCIWTPKQTMYVQDQHHFYAKTTMRAQKYT